MIHFKRSIWQLFMTLIVYAFSVAGGSSQTIPVHPEGSNRAGVTLDYVPIKNLYLGSYRISLGEQSLTDALVEMHTGNIMHAGDAGDSVYWICYTISADGPGQRIWIISDGELGGREHEITSVQADLVRAEKKPTISCPTLPREYSPPHLDHHLWLGSTVQTLTDKFGKAPSIKNGWWSYTYNGTLHDDSEKTSSYDVTSTFDVNLKEAHVVSLVVTQLMTN